MTVAGGAGRFSRREAIASGVAVFAAALVVRLWAASLLTFPRPEDVAYYVGVARNLLEGRGLTMDAIWSYGTPPLTFPRQAFEIWLPMPTFLAAFPMALLGHTFAAAQWSSILVGSLVPVLAWRLGADVAEARSLPVGRARTLALGAGLTTAVSLPLILHSVEPDSTIPFAALTLAACLLMARLIARPPTGAIDGRLALLGVVLGLAALTRNEVAWIALAWAVLAWRSTRARGSQETGPRPHVDARADTFAGRPARRSLRWFRLLALPAAISVAMYVPWLVRDWAAFGTPFPGQAVSNAFFLRSTDVFAWQDPPTLARYLAAGPTAILDQHWTGLVHDLVNVLLFLGIPVSAIGLIALPWTARGPALRALGPLVLVSVVVFLATSLLFPVATLSGTFLHAAGAIHVLLVISALLALDVLIAAVGRRRGWTRPVAWLGPTLTIAASLLFAAVLLPAEGRTTVATGQRYSEVAIRLAAAGFRAGPDAPPAISDTPIWLSEETGIRALALPDEPPASVLDLAQRFGATVLVVDAGNAGTWPNVLTGGAAGSECFEKLDPSPVPSGVSAGPANDAGAPAPSGFLIYRIRCP